MAPSSALRKDAYFLNHTGHKTTKLISTNKVKLCFIVQAKQNIDDLVLGFMIKNRLGIEIYGTNTSYMNIPFSIEKSKPLLLVFEFDLNIGVGIYYICASLHSSAGHTDQNYQWIENLLSFEVDNISKHKFIGTTYLDAKFYIHKDINEI